MSVADTHRTIDAIWRIESSKIIAYLTRMVRDVGIAEDLAQDALIALEHWPIDGIPDNPGGWLMTARSAKRWISRRNKVRDQKYERRTRNGFPDGFGYGGTGGGEVNDDLLRLIFMTCHPVLSLRRA